jgi:hypothetical protein
VADYCDQGSKTLSCTVGRNHAVQNMVTMVLILYTVLKVEIIAAEYGDHGSNTLYCTVGRNYVWQIMVTRVLIL